MRNEAEVFGWRAGFSDCFITITVDVWIETLSETNDCGWQRGAGEEMGQWKTIGNNSITVPVDRPCFSNTATYHREQQYLDGERRRCVRVGSIRDGCLSLGSLVSAGVGAAGRAGAAERLIAPAQVGVGGPEGGVGHGRVQVGRHGRRHDGQLAFDANAERLLKGETALRVLGDDELAKLGLEGFVGGVLVHFAVVDGDVGRAADVGRVLHPQRHLGRQNVQLGLDRFGLAGRLSRLVAFEDERRQHLLGQVAQLGSQTVLVVVVVEGGHFS